MILIACATAGLLSFATVALLLRSGAARVALDLPNERSLHASPTPRIGGLGIMAGALPVLAMSGLPPVLPAVAALLAALSFVDDRRGLPVALRFGAHLLAAAALAGLWPAPWPGVMAAGAVMLGTVWMTNLYNFMDGSDGLAGGMAVCGFGACGLAARLAGDASLAAACLGLAGAAAGFLWFNRHPARVFMGDAGSIPLGFLAAAIGVAGWQRGAWPVWFQPVVFGPFVADATVTLLRRAWRGERVWQAHRSHYYQRLVQLGFGHARTARVEYALMLASAAVALAAVRASSLAAISLLALLAGAYVLAARWIDRRWDCLRPAGSHP